MAKQVDYWLDDKGFKFRQGQEIFLFCTMLRVVVGHIQLPMRVPTLRIKWIGGEADYSPASTAKVKNE